MECVSIVNKALGDSGFGEILAHKLDKLGLGVFAGVFLEASSEKLKSTSSERMVPLMVDVSNESSVENVATQIREILKEKNGQLVGIVNNAGILVQPGMKQVTTALQSA